MDINHWFDDGLGVNRCWCSRVKCQYQREGCNTHTMNDRMAAQLSSIAIRFAWGNPCPVSPWLVLQKCVEIGRGALSRCGPWRVKVEVAIFLEECRQKCPPRCFHEFQVAHSAGVFKTFSHIPRSIFLVFTAASPQILASRLHLHLQNHRNINRRFSRAPLGITTHQFHFWF